MPDTDASTDAPTSATDADADKAAGDSTDWKAEAEKWQSLARKHEDRAKANAGAAKELDEFRRQSMSEQERAIEAARAEGRAEAAAQLGGRLAEAEFRAVAAGRMSDDQLSTLLEGVNLARFVGENGEIDRAAVARFVDGIAPKQQDEPKVPAFPDLGQGARTDAAMSLNGDPLLQSVKAKLGISG